MKARAGFAVLACLATGALAIPSGATAKPGYLVSPPYFSISAQLPKSNGYAVNLEAVGHRWVEMVVGRHGETAIYHARGKASRHGIDVDFGRLGQVHARFTGHRAEREPLFPGCRGERRIEVRGRLEGNFHFKGENGYATVSTRRAKASYERGFKEVCDFGPERDDDKELIDVLEAAGRTSTDRLVSFRATYLAAIDAPVISASTWELVGKVIALKITTTFDEGSKLEFSPLEGRPKTATVSPTSPFLGSASYLERLDRPAEWSGDLRVPFAGLGTVALTGPSFHADACRIRLSNQALLCGQQRQKAQGTVAPARLSHPPAKASSTAAAPTPSP